MDAKAAARETIEDRRAALVDLSHRIHAHPELAFEEEKASAWCAGFLADAGFAIEKPFCGLDTAFRARKGNGPLHVAFCAEYDALPSIGHACGHNVIATMSLGAALAAARVADEVGLTVTVVGTPAEEHGGGKILLLERGGFADEHLAMMAHPAPIDAEEFPSLACANLEVSYTGKAAHAAAFPQLGVNALDALTVAQTALGLLRQHIDPTDRLHGIVTHGGDAPNVVPARTAARYLVRSQTLGRLERLLPRVRNCFEAGALATGAKLGFEASKPYADMRQDGTLGALYRRNASELGRSFPDLGRSSAFSGSTDMGNVSHALPSIHPLIGLDSLPAVPHQPEFADCARTEVADRAVFDGGLAMAWTAIDVACDDALRERLLLRTR
ncbi:MAG: M20 family metallopeptidase [Deltaproteobacteria bacterium]